MTGPRPDARRRQRRGAAWIAATVLGGGAWAQSVGDAPKPVGFPAGPVVIAPSLTAGYSYDSNVFLKPEEALPPPDQVLTLQPALQLTIPFSNSMFRLADRLTWVDYKVTPQVAGRTSNDALVDLTLKFGSLDILDLSARHIAGVAETLVFDPGGEVLRGNSYQLHTEGVAFFRQVGGARGYRFALARNALRFDRSPEVFAFDYRGFDGEGAYLQPLSPNTWLSFGYLGTRYDHYDIGPDSDPFAVYRTENGDAVYAQIEGRLGPKQPYSVRVGWERLAFAGNAAKDFSGLIGQAQLSAIVGGGTIFTVIAQRQPYRSFFEDGDPLTEDNNFYVFEQIGGRVDRPFPRGSSVGGDLSFSRNTYSEPAAGIRREDRTIWLEAYANLAVRDRVVFRLSILKNRRYSNYPGADYSATVVFGGFVIDWI